MKTEKAVTRRKGLNGHNRVLVMNLFFKYQDECYFAFGRPFVKRFALSYRTVACPVCLILSVTLVCCELWPNGWMDQDKTWQVGRPRPRPHCVRWGPSSPGTEAQQPPLSKFTGKGFACINIIRGPCLLWPNSWMDQDVIWYEGRSQSRSHCIFRWAPSSPTPKRGIAAPNFRPMSTPCLKKRPTFDFLWFWHTQSDYDNFWQKCYWESKISDDALYTVWPDPRSRLRVLESHPRGVDRTFRTGLILLWV